MTRNLRQAARQAYSKFKAAHPDHADWPITDCVDTVAEYADEFFDGDMSDEQLNRLYEHIDDFDF